MKSSLIFLCSASLALRKQKNIPKVNFSSDNNESFSWKTTFWDESHWDCAQCVKWIMETFSKNCWSLYALLPQALPRESFQFRQNQGWQIIKSAFTMPSKHSHAKIKLEKCDIRSRKSTRVDWRTHNHERTDWESAHLRVKIQPWSKQYISWTKWAIGLKFSQNQY